MMEDDLTFEHIDTQQKYDLQQLFQNDPRSDELSDSPFELCNNTCLYYEPCGVNEAFSRPNDDLSIFCLNCQGIRAHWDSFYNLVQEMGKDSRSFDVIGVTEIFGMSQGECALPGYHPLEFSVRNNSNNSKGGIGIYVKASHKYKLRSDLSIFIPHVFESKFIELTFDNKRIIIGTVYRPNSFPKADIDIFMHTMNELQQLLGNEHKDIYIIGDMNIDLLKFSDHVKTGEYLDNIFSQGFLPLIVKPTRLTSHSATLIDHIYTNKLEINVTSGIVVTDVSDHFGVFSIIKRVRNDNPSIQNKIISRSFSKSNIDRFNMKLQHIDYTSVFEATSPDSAYDNFMHLYFDAYDTAFPLTEIKTPRKYIKRLPWFTKGLIRSSITKSKLLRKKTQNGTTTNIHKYKTYTSIYNKLCRQAKASYYDEQIQLARNNVKLTWTILKKAINKHNYKIDLPEHFTHQNVTIKDPKQIAVNFNKFFLNIGTKLSEHVPPSEN